MKVSLMAVLVFTLLGCAAGQIVPPEQRVLQQTHEIELTKDKIYSRSLEWMAHKFSDSKEVIELKDEASGKIIGKGITKFSPMLGAGPIASCRFTLMIEVKDGKYRTTYDDFKFIGAESGNVQELERKEYVDQVKSNLIAIDYSLLQFLADSKHSKDW